MGTGKGFDTFCPLGPWIETDLDPGALAITTRRDGEVVQDGTTADMVHGVATLISHASKAFTLLPGDDPHGDARGRPARSRRVSAEVEVEASASWRTRSSDTDPAGGGPPPPAPPL